MANTNMEPYWDLIKRIIQESDVVLEILDARLVELSRNEEVEKLIEEAGRPIIFVVNKTDLVDKNRVKEQIKDLMNKGEVVYISAKDKSSFKILLYMIKKVFKEYGKRKETDKPLHREAKADIVVGVLGYPNVGKSSIINLLCHRKKAKVSRKPGTTHGIHWIRATPEIKLIDSPGVIPLSKEDEIRYGLIGARGEETLRHPDVVAYAVIKLFLEKNKNKLEKFYDIKIEDENEKASLLSEDNEGKAYEVILQIAKRRNFLIKGGQLDENRTCSLILRDWQDGRLRL